MTDEPDVQCPCCKLFYEAHDPPAFPKHSVPLHFRLRVCWDCVNHQDLTTEEGKFNRGRVHGRLLRREYLGARKRIQQAHQELVAMQRELAMRPTQVVVRVENLDKIIVEEAETERAEALRRRDVAMGALSDVRMLHHRAAEDKAWCSCGTRYRQCDVAQLVDRWDGVRWWEESQAGRAFRGYRHHLDRSHPALKDPDWFDKTYGDE